MQPADELFMVPFEMTLPQAMSQNASLICNFCCTWHNNNGAGLMTYVPPHLEEGNTIGTNVCRDLRCSEHVRTKTNASVRSRVQLPETLAEDSRIRRLKDRLVKFIANSKLVQVGVHE